MLVDVIIPVRNGGTWIGDAIRSVRQDSSVIGKIIVIDDGSTDDTVAIVRNLPTDGKLVLIRQAPSGLIATLNNGLRLATAPLIGRMDADDLSLPGRFVTQARFLSENPAITVVGAQIAYIDVQGTPLGDHTSFPVRPEAVADALFAGRCVISHPSVTMRRDAILAYGGYRSAFQAAEDYDLWLRVAEKSRIANLSEICLLYRRHKAQIGEVNKIRQGFSHDLALLCSRERRKGFPDPLADKHAAPDFHPIDPAFQGAPDIFRDLARAYRAVVSMQAKVAVHPADLAAVLRLAKLNLLGEGRATRIRILKRTLGIALSNRNWMIAQSTIQHLLRLRMRQPPNKILAARLLDAQE